MGATLYIKQLLVHPTAFRHFAIRYPARGHVSLIAEQVGNSKISEKYHILVGKICKISHSTTLSVITILKATLSHLARGCSLSF